MEQIEFPEDLRKIPKEQLPQLAKELRIFITDQVAVKEGHLGASLGVIELTIALHYMFNTPEDLLIWDVGHQAYGHKILCGRRKEFHTNREYGGISGFPRRIESEYDVFGTGHSSTSISAALGMAMASLIKGDHEREHIAVIGDASIASGMAFEGLNHAGMTNANLLVILNDNAIGIDPSVGALKNYLTEVKKGKTLSDNIFEALNFDYSGPIDGNDLDSLFRELQRLKNKKGPRILHISTIKGKGLSYAEKDQITFHAPGKFDPSTGELSKSIQQKQQPPKFQDVFGLTLVELAKENDKIIGITPAMPTGSSLKYMMNEFPNRAFDVGIAEQHAVTFAAGLAAEGMIPFCAIYSTFLQRAYDQLIHDVAIQKLPVTFCIDRAGLVGQDGATHHGVFDLAYLRCIPNMIIAAPSDEIELRNIMFTAQQGLDSPIAIRYPRGRGQIVDWKKSFETVEIGKGRSLRKGKKLAVISIGTMATLVESCLNHYDKNNDIAHFDIRFLKPLDKSLLEKVFTDFNTVVTIEDGCLKGGLADAIREFASQNFYTKKISSIGIPDEFIEHGTVDELRSYLKMDIENLWDKLRVLI